MGLHSEEIANITSMLEEFFAFSLTNQEVSSILAFVTLIIKFLARTLSTHAYTHLKNYLKNG